VGAACDASTAAGAGGDADGSAVTLGAVGVARVVVALRFGTGGGACVVVLKFGSGGAACDPDKLVSSPPPNLGAVTTP
jgi:hypothetical protein